MDFCSILPQILMISEYCLSVMVRILTLPLSGTKFLTRFISTFTLSCEPQYLIYYCLQNLEVLSMAYHCCRKTLPEHHSVPDSSIVVLLFSLADFQSQPRRHLLSARLWSFQRRLYIAVKFIDVLFLLRH